MKRSKTEYKKIRSPQSGSEIRVNIGPGRPRADPGVGHPFERKKGSATGRGRPWEDPTLEIGRRTEILKNASKTIEILIDFRKREVIFRFFFACGGLTNIGG